MEREYAILRIHLSDSIPAYEFSRLTSLINDVYDNFLWFEYVRKSKRTPYSFKPAEYDQLNIFKAEIGTPNKIEFLGVIDHLISTINYLGKYYNSLINLEKAYFTKVEDVNSAPEMFQVLNSDYKDEVVSEEEAKRLLDRPSPSLEQELEDLSSMHHVDKEIKEEKINFINYLRNISLTTENIINYTEFILVKIDAPLNPK